jgi:hypothetical protein
LSIYKLFLIFNTFCEFPQASYCWHLLLLSSLIPVFLLYLKSQLLQPSLLLLAFLFLLAFLLLLASLLIPEVKTDPCGPAVTGFPVAGALAVSGSPAIAGVPILLVVWCSSQTQISNMFDSII